MQTKNIRQWRSPHLTNAIPSSSQQRDQKAIDHAWREEIAHRLPLSLTNDIFETNPRTNTVKGMIRYAPIYLPERAQDGRRNPLNTKYYTYPWSTLQILNANWHSSSMVRAPKNDFWTLRFDSQPRGIFSRLRVELFAIATIVTPSRTVIYATARKGEAKAHCCLDCFRWWQYGSSNHCWEVFCASAVSRTISVSGLGTYYKSQIMHGIQNSYGMY